MARFMRASLSRIVRIKERKVQRLSINIINIKMLKWLVLSLIGLHMSANANLISPDFGAGIADWQVEIMGDPDPASPVVLPGDAADLVDVVMSGTNTVTIQPAVTNYNGSPTEIWSVVLFQDFMLTPSSAGSTFALAVDILSGVSSAADDFIFAQIRDLDNNMGPLDLLAGGVFDVSAWVGVNSTIEFGVIDGDFLLQDFLTVSNLSITETISQVPAPALGALFVFAVILLGAKRRNAVKNNPM